MPDRLDGGLDVFRFGRFDRLDLGRFGLGLYRLLLLSLRGVSLFANRLIRFGENFGFDSGSSRSYLPLLCGGADSTRTRAGALDFGLLGLLGTEDSSCGGSSGRALLNASWLSSFGDEAGSASGLLSLNSIGLAYVTNISEGSASPTSGWVSIDGSALGL